MTDNARNIDSEFSRFNNKDNQYLHHILCTVHTLQLEFTDAIKESKVGDVL